MKKAVKYGSYLLIVLIASASLPAFAQAANGDVRSVVHSSNGQVVTSGYNQCVRIDWDAGADECAPQVAQEICHAQPPKVVLAPRTEIGVEQRTVYFPFDKSSLTAEAQGKLDSLTTMLRSAGDVKDVRIAGYADRIGSVKYNDRLSQKRAEAVKDYMVQHGYVNASVAQTRWLGKSDPVTHCSATIRGSKLIGCLQDDRRVQVDLDYTHQVPRAH